MTPALLVLAAVAGLFVLLLAVRAWTGTPPCVLCGAVSLTWIVLLGLLWTGRFPEPVLVGVLIGQSITGLTSLLAAKAREDLRIFRLPFFLTATAGAFIALGKTEQWTSLLLFSAALWAVAAAVSVFRRDARVRGLARSLIACCRDW